MVHASQENDKVIFCSHLPADIMISLIAQTHLVFSKILTSVTISIQLMKCFLDMVLVRQSAVFLYLIDTLHLNALLSHGRPQRDYYENNG